jgi:precorrin isomerase
LAVGGVVALLWPRRERVEGHAFAIPAPDRRIVVEVLNGTGRQGLARVATRILRRQGIDVVFLGNADSAQAATRVIVRRGESDRARTVATALGIGAVSEALDTLRRVDVSVILGADFHPKGDLHP